MVWRDSKRPALASRQPPMFRLVLFRSLLGAPITLVTLVFTALNADSNNPDLANELRSIVTAEAIMLLFVVVVTAWLVSAAS